MASVTVMFGAEDLGTYGMRHHPFLVGRAESCDICIDNVGISREHCRILWDGKHFYAEDMGSSNGTYHYGHRIRKTSIADGSELLIGKFTIVFHHAPGDPVPPSRAEAGQSGPGPGLDPMLTFKMDGRDVVKRLSGRETEPMKPRRAADVAGPFGRPPPRSMPPAASAGSASKKFVPRREGSILGMLVKGAAVLAFFAVVVAATLYVLRLLGLIDA